MGHRELFLQCYATKTYAPEATERLFKQFLAGALRSSFWILAEDFQQSHDCDQAENYTLRTICRP